MYKEFFENRKIILFFAVISCILWGSAYPAIKIGYDIFQIETSDIESKILFAGYRFVLAGLMVLALAMFLKKSIFKMNKKQLLSLVILGLTQTSLQYAFFYIIGHLFILIKNSTMTIFIPHLFRSFSGFYICFRFNFIGSSFFCIN